MIVLRADDGVVEPGQAGTMRRRRRPRPLTVVVGLVLVGSGAGAAAFGGPLLERHNIYLVPPSPQHYAEAALEQMRAGIDASPEVYEQVREEVTAEVAQAASYTDTYDALARAAKTLGGEHSEFLAPDEAAEVFDGAPADDEPARELPGVTTEAGVTTVTLPALVGGTPSFRQDYVDAAVQGIVEAAPVTTLGWVVDLRDNHGGNLWPMLAGVSPLLDDGAVLSFEYQDRSDVVTVEGGTVALSGAPQARTGNDPEKTALPVAVLVDGMTGSSAEAVAIAFVGQHDVRVFGQPTYGFSTTNTPVRLYDGAVVNLTVAVDADRTGQRYGSSLQPDVLVEGDEVTRSAVAWLGSAP
jgi:carboxyl-terminal processing protease